MPQHFVPPQRLLHASPSLPAGALGVLSLTGGKPGDALAAWDYRQTAAAKQRRRTSFRSVKEAVTAAQDGDRILLRRGTHNGMGCALRCLCRSAHAGGCQPASQP
jgi:hypothetical protein